MKKILIIISIPPVIGILGALFAEYILKIGVLGTSNLIYFFAIGFLGGILAFLLFKKASLEMPGVEFR